MKYLLTLVLLISPIFAQESTKELTLVENSVVRRKDKAIFKAFTREDDSNFINATIIVRCSDFTSMLLLLEGKLKGQEFLIVDTKVQETPEKDSVISKIFTKVCSLKSLRVSAQESQAVSKTVN